MVFGDFSVLGIENPVSIDNSVIWHELCANVLSYEAACLLVLGFSHATVPPLNIAFAGRSDSFPKSSPTCQLHFCRNPQIHI